MENILDFYDTHVGATKRFALASFHTGKSFFYHKTERDGDWSAICQALIKTAQSRMSPIISGMTNDTKTEYFTHPGDIPLTFSTTIPNTILCAFTANESRDYNLNVRVFFYNTGLVIIAYSAICDTKISEEIFEDIFEDNYEALTNQFLEIYAQLQALLSAENIDSIASNEAWLERIDVFRKDRTKCKEYSGELVIDIHYIHNTNNGHDNYKTSNIGYVNARFDTTDWKHIYCIFVIYPSFAFYLWLTSYLSNFTRSFIQKTSTSKIIFSDITDVETFRLFCSNFINESRPINIRIHNRYIYTLQATEEALQLRELSQQLIHHFTIVEECTRRIFTNFSANQQTLQTRTFFILTMFTLISVAVDILSFNSYYGTNAGDATFTLFNYTFKGASLYNIYIPARSIVFSATVSAFIGVALFSKVMIRNNLLRLIHALKKNIRKIH